MDSQTAQMTALVQSHQQDLLDQARRNRLGQEAGSGHDPFAFRQTLSRPLEAWWSALAARLRPDHSLTDYPCRTPDGRMGRVAAVFDGQEWTLVCKLA